MKAIWITVFIFLALVSDLPAHASTTNVALQVVSANPSEHAAK